MQAKDLTKADIGKWVMLKAKVAMIDYNHSVRVGLHDINDNVCSWIYQDAIIKFTTPPVQEVGDVFYNGDGDMWTLRAIVGDACLLTGPDHDGHTDGIRGERYPLPRTFTLLHKGQ